MIEELAENNFDLLSSVFAQDLLTPLQLAVLDAEIFSASGELLR